MSDSFAHLHCHTEYSMLDGAARLKAMFGKAVLLGQPAAAITDHGTVQGQHHAWTEAAALQAAGHDFKAIIGCELYVAPASRFTKNRVYFGAGGKKAKKGADEFGKDVSGDGSYTHMTMLALNAQGLRALNELTSRASIEGAYSAVGADKPRIDADLLAEAIAHWPGAQLVGTTGCPSGAIQTRLRLGQTAEAEAEVQIWRDILGADNYFMELMDHQLDLETRLRADLIRLANRMNLPVLATNDSHYVEPADAKMHDALLCIQMGKKLDDVNRMKFSGDRYYLRSSDEMRVLFANLSEACDNTLEIASRVAPNAYDEVLGYQDDLLPEFAVPEGYTAATFLREKIVIGLQEKYPDPDGPEGIQPAQFERGINYELKTIVDMGYPDYMLMVWDFVNWSRTQAGIRVGPGRGSAAGSLVSYALGITSVPTIEHGLLFERFINPERVSPPDVDIDFEQGRRDEVFRYLAEKYGEDRVCRIQTFNRIKAKAALKDACRVLGVPFAIGAKLTAAYPKAISGFDASLDCVTDENHERYPDADGFRALLGKEEQAQAVFELAVQLEGLVRSAGMHACGFVVSRYPLMGRIPLVWDKKSKQIVSALPNAESLEPMGYLKVDVLGLDTMDVIQRCVVLIREKYGIDVEADLVGLKDPAAYEQLSSGSTVGMFQVASSGMAKLMQLMQADRFEDISAGLALYRPGPMGANAHEDYALRKTGRQRIRDIHPDLHDALLDILGPTYGVICYQEQVMRAVQAVAGYSLGRADLLRKAMGKKKPEVLAKEFVPFRDGMRKQGYGDDAVQALWDIFLPFSAYAFNIAHTVSYGYITYATAWLKAHYPAVFMSSLLTQAGDDKDKKAMYLGECRRMRQKVLVPDVNASMDGFTATDEGIRFGLSAVSGLGPGAVRGIIQGREDGPYKDFADFLKRVPDTTCTKTAVGALVRAGAFDSLGHTRRSLIDCFEAGVGQMSSVKKKEAQGQFDLFSVTDEVELESVTVPDLAEWDKEFLLQQERAALSFYVSGHPLDALEEVLAGNRTVSIIELVTSDATEGTMTLAGQIVAVEHKTSAAGKNYCRLTLADLDAQTDVMVFGQAYGTYRHLLEPDAKVVMKARLNQREGRDDVSVVADVIGALDMSKSSAVHKAGDGPRPVVLTMTAARTTPALVEQIKVLMQRYPGQRPVQVNLTMPDGTERFHLPGFQVESSVQFVSEMKVLVGRANLIV